MNLKGFKKLSSDKDMTVMKHPQGHEIKVMHSALSPLMKARLKELPMHKMAEGGDPLAGVPSISDSKGVVGGYLSDSTNPKPDEKLFPLPKQMPSAQNKSYSDVPLKNEQPAEQAYCGGGKVKMYAEGTPPGGVSASDSGDNGASNVSVGDEAAPVEKFPVPAPDPSLAAPPSFPGDPYASANSLSMKGLQEQQQGNQMSADVTGALGQKNAGLYQQSADLQNSSNNLINANLYKYTKDRQALYQDWANGHIDPKAYINGLSSGQKLSSGIGILLGGIAQGKTGQPNLAYDFLNKQIDRDVAAQQQNFTNKGTLYAANLKETQNAKDAYDLTVSQNKDLLAMHLQQMAGNLAQPAAQAAALTASGKLKQEAGALLGPIAQRQAMMQSMQGGNASGAQQIRAGQVMGYIPEAQANDLYKQLQTAETMGKSKDAVLSAFDQVGDQQTIANRALNPIQSQAQIDALWDPSIAQLTKDSDGRITPTDLPMMNSMKPNLVDDKNTRMLKRQKLDQFVTQKMNFPMLDAYNVKPNSGNYTKPQAAPRGANQPKYTPGQLVKLKDGRQARISPDGNSAIPVK